MVKEESYKGSAIFICEECGLGYPTKKLAKKCEEFCKKNHSCSIEITAHAVKK